jgi:hypothetical protein
MWKNYASFIIIINYETLPTESLIIQTKLLDKAKAGNGIFNHRNDAERRRKKYKLHAIHTTEEWFLRKPQAVTSRRKLCNRLHVAT